ncbi:hypothetical protein G6F32_007237 [Rhizopus arrhizus]|nr:hypothetical protein G6F24_007093 [Rhizopus arrhizus]KAG0944740.1 hypothetical protein G6F32_007237 [Rhizopus arrhizus]
MFIGYLLLILAIFGFYYSIYQINGGSIFIKKSLLDDWISKQNIISFNSILKNINPSGTPRGFVAASLSTSYPDYFYTWTRDAALVVRVLSDLSQTDDNILKDYIDFQTHIQNTPTVCHCLGEPKFNPDGTGYTGSWGRPQNDGPAERAITLIKIANRLKDPAYVSQKIVPILEKDLDYILQVWEQPCFDLWEEVDGSHFYTLMAMQRALLDAFEFFNLSKYRSTAYRIQEKIERFWSSEENYIRVTHEIREGANKPSGLDVSVLMAVNMFATTKEEFFTPGSDKVLATAAAIEKSFSSIYPINKNLQPDLGVAIGRYPEDVYDGYGSSKGNPWFLTTAAYVELYYLAIKEWKQTGLQINAVNKPFFERFLPIDDHDIYYSPDSQQLEEIIHLVSLEADKFLATIQYHQQRNGSMSEQYSRYDGYMQGARDLTWSHAAFISAIKAREGNPITF